MLFVFMGPSCTGKSSVAKEVNDRVKGEVFTGKDYLRLAKNKDNAWNKFIEKMNKISGEKDAHMIYITSEISAINKIKSIDGLFIKFTADLETIKERFSKRTNGHLPQPLVKMLENQVNAWSEVEADYTFDNSKGKSIEEISEKLLAIIDKENQVLKGILK